MELRPTSDTHVELHDETGKVGELTWITRDQNDPEDTWDADGWHGSLQMNGPEGTTSGHTTAAKAYAALLPGYDKLLKRRAYLQDYEKRADRLQRSKRTVSIPMGGQPRR